MGLAESSVTDSYPFLKPYRFMLFFIVLEAPSYVYLYGYIETLPP